MQEDNKQEDIRDQKFEASFTTEGGRVPYLARNMLRRILLARRGEISRDFPSLEYPEFD